MLGRAKVDDSQLLEVGGTPFGRAYVAAKYLKPAEEAKARERQLATQNNDAGRAVQEKLPEQGGGQARDLAAAQVGLSGKTVDAASRAIEERERGGFSPLVIGHDPAL